MSENAKAKTSKDLTPAEKLEIVHKINAARKSLDAKNYERATGAILTLENKFRDQLTDEQKGILDGLIKRALEEQGAA